MTLTARPLCLALLAALALPAAAFAAQPDQLPASARAKGLLDANPAAAKRAAGDQFVARDVIVDRDGTEHVRLHRSYKGLPVIGGDLVVHSRNGQLKSVSKTLKSELRPDLKATISRDDAITTAGVAFGTGFKGVPTAELVVFALDASPRLAYQVVFAGTRADQTPTRMNYFVDAASGRILRKWDQVNTAKPGAGGGAATGAGKSLFLGDVPVVTTAVGGKTGYQMIDASRGGGTTFDARNRLPGDAAVNFGLVVTDTNNVWGDYTTGDRATAAVDAHYGVAATWDYYRDVHARNGIWGDGRAAGSYVHAGFNYVNAAWDGANMYYGDGNGTTVDPLIAIDVAGHEMSHGVTGATAGLIYSGESGGLNEATSDIFGTMVERHANNPKDTPDYLIGETFLTKHPTVKALRYMFKPSLEGATRSKDCWYSGIGNIDVHFSSGPANHFYYLLAEGAVVPAGFGAGTTANLTPASLVCNGNTALAGIGADAAEKIWYRALTVYFTSNTKYAGARAGTLSAANDLYGIGSPQSAAVAASWSAVGVN